MNTSQVSLAFIFLITFSVSSTDPTHFTITGDVSINCGSAGASSSRSGRKWLGDAQPKPSSLLQLKGSSTTTTVISYKLTSADPVPYMTVRASRAKFSYAFQVNPGQKIIRLHFNPTAYRGFKGLTDLFTVEAGHFTLLSNFSASLTADALSVNSLTKEFCLNIQENQLLDISFSAETGKLKDAYAFVNGIEIISVPVSFSYFQGQDIGLHVVGQNSLVYVDYNIGLEIIHKQIVKQDLVSTTDDSDDIFRVWVNLHEVSNSKNERWKIPVDVGFRYLVRLHFSKLGLKMAENGALNFKVYINEMIANTNIDVLVKERDGSSISWHGDYMVMMNGRKLEGKRDLLIRLQSNEEYMDGPLKGFEILKMSNHDNSLASPIHMPPSHDAKSQAIQIMIKVLGNRNAIGTVVITIIAIVCVIVHKLREIWEASSSEEENKPSEKAERVSRRFSLSEMQLATRNFSDGLLLGRGGFGKVYKGLIDKEQTAVAVKRLKSNSKQGAREFLTEIETLSELRHINLVSLIGYCREGREMMLVYEYMACGTLADHLYHFARRGIDASTLTWNQRLNICIGAARGIDYLHTGQRVIHRDVKTSNILLDENFVARVSDFGLAKPEDRTKLQSHVSTKVKGTFGYLDPYYLTTRRLTRKSDTYAFGVVLLEVLCGRPAVDSGVSEDAHILTIWAQDKISKGEADQIVASSLSDEISPNSLKTFVGITERCLDYEPKSRPTMSQVLLQLEFALEQQESHQNLGLNEVAKGTRLSSTLQPTVDPISMQRLTLPPNQQTNNKVDNTDSISGRKHREKSSKYKATRSWSWEAFWSRVKPSKKYESLLSELESFAAVLKLPKYDWDQIAAATNHFSSSRVVGYGRFGTFYKAVLPSGEVVAVKRGSLSPAYAKKLFKMESIVLSNLQHPNIIKLLGYCIKGETLWLLYEFMENGSLDYIIGQHQHLEWAVSFQIMIGIARGLVYLHHDSGLSVIHGDLKLANILLDLNMSPKISGLYFSSSAVEYQSELEISLVQDIGYMFPEYLKHMKSTVKTDVYSLGVILLEIVSGRRKYSHIKSRSLVEHAWYLWNEGRAIELVDDSMGSAFEEDEAIRCIQVALLCIQDHPDQRPLMSSVINMLEGNEQILQPCRQPPNEVPAGIIGNTSVDNDELDSSNATFELDDTLESSREL